MLAGTCDSRGAQLLAPCVEIGFVSLQEVGITAQRVSAGKSKFRAPTKLLTCYIFMQAFVLLLAAQFGGWRTSGANPLPLLACGSERWKHQLIALPIRRRLDIVDTGPCPPLAITLDISWGKSSLSPQLSDHLRCWQPIHGCQQPDSTLMRSTAAASTPAYEGGGHLSSTVVSSVTSAWVRQSSAQSRH